MSPALPSSGLNIMMSSVEKSAATGVVTEPELTALGSGGSTTTWDRDTDWVSV